MQGRPPASSQTQFMVAKHSVYRVISTTPPNTHCDLESLSSHSTGSASAQLGHMLTTLISSMLSHRHCTTRLAMSCCLCKCSSLPSPRLLTGIPHACWIVSPSQRFKEQTTHLRSALSENKQRTSAQRHCSQILRIAPLIPKTLTSQNRFRRRVVQSSFNRL